MDAKVQFRMTELDGEKETHRVMHLILHGENANLSILP